MIIDALRTLRSGVLTDRNLWPVKTPATDKKIEFKKMHMRLVTTFFVVLIFSSSFSQNISCARVIATVKVNNSDWVRATEVSIKEYFNFILCNNFDPELFPDPGILNLLPYKLLLDDFLKNKDSKYFKFLIRDSGYVGYLFSVKKQGSKEQNEKIKNLLAMPVTGISYEQAMQYCKWLENKWNFYMKKYPVCHLTITLPALELYKHLIKENNGIVKLNASIVEMTSTKKLSVKLLYSKNDNEPDANKQISYSKPETWLGFRFIVLTNQ